MIKTLVLIFIMIGVNSFVWYNAGQRDVLLEVKELSNKPIACHTTILDKNRMLHPVVGTADSTDLNLLLDKFKFFK